ncbi:MAG: B12-binding domain-containing protein [Nitriliruptoraceae bacterium]
MSATIAAADVEHYLELAIAGDRRRAVRRVLDLVDEGMPPAVLITDLLGAAQHEVGERWQRAQWTTADEHLVTGVSQAALEALATSTATPVEPQGQVVVACAEGDWHALASQMFAELLRARGAGVDYLGASTPADDVAAFLARRRPDALAVTCNLALSYLGTARLVDAAHRQGVAVLVGGRALTPARAAVLGADAYGSDVAEALEILRAWREAPPTVSGEPVGLDQGALELDQRSGDLADVAFVDLERRFPELQAYDKRQRARTREDLVYIVRYLAAARLVDDPAVYTEFLGWLEPLLAARGVPESALTAGLESLAHLVRDSDEDAYRLVAAGMSKPRA